jgi:hypothetical protein
VAQGAALRKSTIGAGIIDFGIIDFGIVDFANQALTGNLPGMA